MGHAAFKQGGTILFRQLKASLRIHRAASGHAGRRFVPDAANIKVRRAWWTLARASGNGGE
jgi:hypothetical protein